MLTEMLTEMLAERSVDLDEFVPSSPDCDRGAYINTANMLR